MLGRTLPRTLPGCISEPLLFRTERMLAESGEFGVRWLSLVRCG